MLKAQLKAGDERGAGRCGRGVTSGEEGGGQCWLDIYIYMNMIFQIDIHKDMLKAQLKAGDEERQQISAELHERISKIDKLRKR